MAFAFIGASAVQPSYYDEGKVNYNFQYGVHDEQTGDIKSQQETREGDVVRGRYELIDSDGFKRIVEYTADDKHGFNAIVRRVPTNIRIPFTVSTQSYQPIYQQKVQHLKHFIPNQLSYSHGVHFDTADRYRNTLNQYTDYTIKTPKTHTPIYKRDQIAHGATHVTFNSPEVNYHY